MLKLPLKTNCVIFNDHINKSIELYQKGIMFSQYSVIPKVLLHVLFYSSNDL